MANNLTSPLLNDSEEDLAVLERRRSSAVFDFEVPEMLLQSMEVYNHPSGYPVTISEMSENHKVLLVFLRHLDCIFCQVTIAKLAVHYKALLQLNTIPVLVHQELKEVADEHFATFQGFKQYQPIVDQMLRVEDLTGTHYYKQFNLGSVGTKNAPLVPTILSARRYTVKGFRNSLFPKDKRADRDQMPGIFLVENGRIINLFQYKTIIDEPLFLELVIDVERSGYGTEATCDLTCTIEKEVLPRKILDEETEDFTENLLTADEDDLLSSTFNTDIYQTHLLAGLDPFLLEEKTKKKKRKFSSICCVCCFVSTADEDISSDLREGILLTEVLSNSDARRYYKLFSAKELSLENVLFWEAVTEYKSTFHHMTHTAQETMAKQIIRTFFTLSSPNELNISSRQKSTTIDLLQKQGPTVALFDSILSNVLSDQMSDTFARFKKTEIFIDEVSRSLLSSSR